MKSIVTITLSPALDKSTSVEEMVPERKLRCSDPHLQPGGGGVNVSRAIKKLGGDSTAIYLAGGHTGKYFQQLLEEENIDSRVIEIQGQTRENFTVIDNSSSLEYRFTMPAPNIQHHEWEQCVHLIETLYDVEYIVVSGSMPPGIPEDFFRRLGAMAKQNNSRLVADTSGQALKQIVNEGVFMIKPNLGELGDLLNVKKLREEDAVKAAKEIIIGGSCEIVVVSMAAAGAVLVTKDIVLSSPSPAIKKRSTVGAGDSMVAGLVHALSLRLTLEDVLRYGIAAGSAATINPGTQLCKKEDVEQLYSSLKLHNSLVIPAQQHLLR